MKVAPYLKAPIVIDSLDVPNTECIPYNNTYHMMNIVKKQDYKTYFYKKIDTINYYRTSQNEIGIFVADYIKDIYKPINLDKTKIIVKSDYNIVIGVNNENWYLVTEQSDLEEQENCLVIINLKDSKILYAKSRLDKNILYLSYYYPIYDVIIPILVVTKQEVLIDLYNILSGQVYSVSLINLESLRELADAAIKRVGRNVSMNGKDIEAIQYARVYEARYRTCTERGDALHVESAYISFDLEVKLSRSYIVDYREQMYLYIFENLKINISTDEGKIYCNMDLGEARFSIDRAHYDEISKRIVKNLSGSTILIDFYNEHRDVVILYETRYEYPYEIPKNAAYTYLSIYMYGNNCYKIINNRHGINIVAKNQEFVTNTEKTNALYRYENYLFILRTDLICQTNLVIIDIKRKLISIVEENIKISSTVGNLDILIKNRLNCILWSIYYSKKHNSFIFISNNYQYLLLVKADEIEKVLNDISMHECESILSVGKIVKVYDIVDLVVEAIQRYVGKINKKVSIYTLGHHIDAQSDRLYLLVKYIAGRKKYICLLEVKIINSNLNLKILYIHNDKSIYSNIKRIGIKNNYINDRFITKLSISGHNNTFIKDLDMLYTDNGTFVSIRYNRKSTRIDELVKSYYGHTNGYITCSLASQYHYGDLIIFRYECKHKNRIYRNQFQTTDRHNNYGIVLVDFAIVRSMNTTNT